MPDSNTIALQLSLQGLAQVEAGVKSLTATMNGLKNAALGGTAAFSGLKIFEWVQNAVQGAAEIGRLAERLGETTEGMSKLEYATKLSGDELQRLFSKFERSQYE